MVQNLLWGTEEHLIRGLNIMLVLFNVIFYTNNEFLQYMCVKKTSFASEKNIILFYIILSDFKEKPSYIIIINY